MLADFFLLVTYWPTPRIVSPSGTQTGTNLRNGKLSSYPKEHNSIDAVLYQEQSSPLD